MEPTYWHEKPGCNVHLHRVLGTTRPLETLTPIRARRKKRELRDLRVCGCRLESSGVLAAILAHLRFSYWETDMSPQLCRVCSVSHVAKVFHEEHWP